MSDFFQAMRYPLEIQPEWAEVADHTYIKCGDHYFNCMGGHYQPGEMTEVTGGSGYGNYATANCYRDTIALENGILNDTAGLIYAVTGVCHQAANRFLYCTENRATVDSWGTNVGGSWASWMAYGTYGTTFAQFIIQYSICTQSPKIMARKVPVSKKYEQHPREIALAKLDDSFSNKVLSDKEPSNDKHIFDQGEIRIQHTNCSDKDIVRHTAIHKELRDKIQTTTYSKTYSDELAHSINEHTNVYLKQLGKILNEETYKTHVKLHPNQSIAIVPKGL